MHYSVRKLVEEYGPVDRVHIPQSAKMGDVRKYGFVAFQHTSDAIRCMKALQDYSFMGKRLSIGYAKGPACERDNGLPSRTDPPLASVARSEVRQDSPKHEVTKIEPTKEVQEDPPKPNRPAPPPVLPKPVFFEGHKPALVDPLKSGLLKPEMIVEMKKPIVIDEFERKSIAAALDDDFRL